MHRNKFWLARAEASLAAVTGSLVILTLFWRDWMEGLTGWNPDHHSGSFEIGLVSVLLIASVTLSSVAYVTYRRLRAVASS
jgi:hypothetical protein